MRNIAHLKRNPNHYLYWLMKYKEEELALLKKLKPQSPKIPKIIYGPEYLYNQLTNLRLKYLKNNNNICYYIINITIKPKIIQNNLLSLNVLSNTWEKRTRIIDDKGYPSTKSRIIKIE